MNIRPIGDKILLTIKPQKETTNSGIILAPARKEQQTTGTIVAIGSKVEAKMEIGQRLLISKHSGTKVTIDEVDYILVREPDALALYVGE